jgi:hypothetical protein
MPQSNAFFDLAQFPCKRRACCEKPPMELLSLSWKRSQEESEVGITSRKIRKEENIEGEKNHGKKKKPSLRRTSIIHHPSANSE